MTRKNKLTEDILTEGIMNLYQNEIIDLIDIYDLIDDLKEDMNIEILKSVLHKILGFYNEERTDDINTKCPECSNYTEEIVRVNVFYDKMKLPIVIGSKCQHCGNKEIY